MSAYNVDSDWDDPFERPEERRASQRFAAPLRVEIAVTDAASGGRLRGPGLVRDMSLSGASIITKHELKTDDRLTLQFVTDGYDDELCLPETFTGTARVRRVGGVKGRRRSLALSFCEDFTSNMDFVLFVDHLRLKNHF